MRYQSLDILKAFGIIYLVALHQMIWMFTYADGNSLRFDEATSIIYPFGYYSGLHVFGLQIPLLAGITFYLSVQLKQLKFNDVVQRSLMLIISGYLMNLLAWGIGDIASWDVLQFIGLAIIISYPFLRSKLALGILAVMGLAALICSNRFPFPQWSSNYFYMLMIGDPSGNNYWPICPWFFVFVVGILVGRLYFEQKRNVKFLYLAGFTMILISVLSGKFFAIVNLEQIWGAQLFKPSPFFVLGIVGFSLVTIPLLESLLSRFNWMKGLLDNSPLIYLGRNIYWVYILSTIIGYNATVNFVMKFPELNFQQTAVAFVVFFILNSVICYWIVKLLERIKHNLDKGPSWQN
jgi:hypothetical protein